MLTRMGFTVFAAGAFTLVARHFSRIFYLFFAAENRFVKLYSNRNFKVYRILFAAALARTRFAASEKGVKNVRNIEIRAKPAESALSV